MIVKRKWSAICELFTLITLISCLINVIQGFTTDTYFHQIVRFVLCFIGVGSLFIFDWFKDHSSYIAMAIHYLATMTVVFIFVWLTKFLEPLATHAFRDVFMNFTAVYIAFVLFLEIKIRLAKKKKSV